MVYNQLGRSDLNISRIGFGCMSLKSDQAENKKIINKALDLGINYFDTADIYDNGNNETYLGEALKGRRNEAIIATKVGNKPKPNGPGWNWNPTKAYIIKSVEGSLRRLQVDYIDLYQLHGGTMEDPIDETIEAFELLKQQGKIRYYGISSIRPNVIRQYIERSSLVNVMTQYSLLDRRPEEETLNLLKENNIGVVARGSVASGLLVDKPAKDYLNYNEEQVSLVASAINGISNHKRSAAQTAIQFVLHNPAITSAIIGIRTMEQLEDAVGAIEAGPLAHEEYEGLIKVLPVNFYKEHR